MRRLVRAYVSAALGRQRADLERFLADRLEVPDAFPLDLAERVAEIREIGRLKITPRGGGDFCEVDILVGLRVAVTATASRREPIRGIRTAAVPEALLGRHVFTLDIEIEALGTLAARGYGITPRQARLTAWWGCYEG